MVGKHESIFIIVDFFACQIIGIVGSRIGTRRFISLTRILTNLKSGCLQLEHF
jgi:hypothetical protein